jgi:hypothetical protein
MKKSATGVPLSNMKELLPDYALPKNMKGSTTGALRSNLEVNATVLIHATCKEVLFVLFPATL